jgi:hypothetical protein
VQNLETPWQIYGNKVKRIKKGRRHHVRANAAPLAVVRTSYGKAPYPIACYYPASLFRGIESPNCSRISTTLVVAAIPQAQTPSSDEKRDAVDGVGLANSPSTRLASCVCGYVQVADQKDRGRAREIRRVHRGTLMAPLAPVEPCIFHTCPSNAHIRTWARYPVKVKAMPLRSFSRERRKGRQQMRSSRDGVS